MTSVVRMLNPLWLRTFVTAAESVSFTQAGRRLGLTQSTVSDHVARLEAQLGRRLFVRDTHSLALTSDGASLLIHARLILDAHARAELQFTGPTLRGHIRLGTSDDMALGPLPVVLARFKRLYPEVDLDLTVGFTDMLRPLLDAGQLDIITGKRREGEPQGQTLYREPLVWFGYEGMVLDDGPLPLAMLAEPSITRAQTLDALARAGRNWRITCNSSGYTGCAAAVRAGLGITALPEQMRFAGLVPLRGLPALPEIEYIALTARNVGRPVQALLKILLESDLSQAGRSFWR
jgi:DNA-binding transcriptional LysR family regulator